MRNQARRPRKRGTLIQTDQATAGRRIIPALAGNSTPGYSVGLPPAHHPRQRGELIRRRDRELAEDASSPPARALLNTSCRVTVAAASSPHARGTPYVAVCASVFSHHPRPSGELRTVVRFCRTVAAPSPPARGTRNSLPVRSVPIGIIPARAGNSENSGPSKHGYSRHPRVGGELCMSEFRSDRTPALSPRARGTPARVR